LARDKRVEWMFLVQDRVIWWKLLIQNT